MRQQAFRLKTTRRFGLEPERARAARLLGRSIETHAAVVSLHLVTQPTRIVLPYQAFNEQGFSACASAQPSL